MMDGSANPRRHISICAWGLCGPSRTGDTWCALRTRESARLSILMAELRLKRQSASGRFWMEPRSSVRIGRSIRNTATFLLTRIYCPLSDHWSGGRMPEELIERFTTLKARAEDVRRFL